MPLTGYMKVPDIAGESTRAGQEDEIEVFAVARGTAALCPAGGAARGRGPRRPIRACLR